MFPLILHPSIEMRTLGDERLQLAGIHQTMTLDDGAGHVRALLSWCDGTRTEDEILTLLCRRLPDGAQLLDFLKQHDFIVSARPASADPLVDQLDAVSRPLEALADPRRTALGNRPLVIVQNGTGELANAIYSALTQLGHEVVPNPSETASTNADIELAVSDTIDHSAFRAVNRRAVELGRYALFAAIDRHVVRVGPIVAPGESACFECYHHRLRSHALSASDFDARVERPRAAEREERRPWLAARAGSVLAVAALLGFVKENPSLGRPDQVVEQDLLTNRLVTRPVLKLPRCPICGPARAERLQPSIYQPAHEA